MKQDNRMMVRADAKAIGAVTAIEPRVTKRWQASKPEQRRPTWGTKGHCLSYKRDADGNVIDLKVYKVASDTKQRSATKHVAVNKQDEIRARLLNLAGNNSDAD